MTDIRYRQDSVIPQDVEAEQAVLGSIIENNNTLGELSSILTPNSFFSVSHQHIYRAMLDLVEMNSPIDAVLLGDQLKSLSQLEEIGGYSYLAELMECSPSSSNVVFYSRIIQEHALLRDLIETAKEIGEKSRDPERNISELLTEAEHKIRQISIRTNQKKYSKIRDLLSKNFQRLEEISQTPDEVTGIPTGFIDLDKRTAGLQNSDLIVIGGRPSMGKTAIALNIASYVATRGDGDGAILIFSLEMSEEQLSARILQAEANVDGKNIKTGNLDQNDWDKLVMATDTLSRANIFINDATNLTPQEVTSITKKLDSEEDGGVSLVIVDYIQLMKGSRSNMPREQEIAEISRSLKALAKDLNIPVIALSQLNRSLENRTDKHPQLSDLRESGAIEQDADIILFIYRDEVYNLESPDKGQAEIIIAKHRNGPTGMLKVSFIGKYTKFGNLSLQGTF